MMQSAAWWGPWTLSGTDLIFRPGELNEYPVDLLTCTDSAQVLDWVCQIAGRFGGEQIRGPEVTGWFVMAIADILHPQANLCSYGEFKSIAEKDITRACKEALRARLPDFRSGSPPLDLSQDVPDDPEAHRP